MSADLPGRAEPLWIASAPGDEHPSLAAKVDADVCVIGAGIVGVIAAAQLKTAGRRVVLVDSSRVLRGVTGRTTAKLTAGHGLIYAELVSKFGDQIARAYADANTKAIEHVANTIEDRGIECDFERRDNVIYTEDPAQVADLRREVEAARAAGLPASFTRQTSLPFEVAGAIRYSDQAQYHPRKYLLSLLASIPGSGSHVFERSHVVGVDDGEPCRVRLRNGEVRADSVIVATHLPFLDRGLYFARAHPTQHVALTAEPGSRVDAMYISTEQPPHSVRMARDGDGTELLLFVGEGAKAGNAKERIERLASWAVDRFAAATFRHRWTAQDYYSVDRMPFVGRLPFSRHTLIATGFSGWGMSGGVAAGLLLSDLVLGRGNPSARLFDARRITPLASAKKFAAENAKVAATWVGDRAKTPRSVEDLAPGEGAIVSLDGRKVAAYRDPGGAVTALSPKCTHQGCLVRWNGVEESWDCPCHGSRFDLKGRVLHGPAVRDLDRLD